VRGRPPVRRTLRLQPAAGGPGRSCTRHSLDRDDRRAPPAQSVLPAAGDRPRPHPSAHRRPLEAQRTAPARV